MENDKKCKKNRTFATECVSYTRRYVYLLNLLEVYFCCFFTLVFYFFPLRILWMIVRLASLIFDTSIEFRYTCVVL